MDYVLLVMQSARAVGALWLHRIEAAWRLGKKHATPTSESVELVEPIPWRPPEVGRPAWGTAAVVWARENDADVLIAWYETLDEAIQAAAHDAAFWTDSNFSVVEV